MTRNGFAVGDSLYVGDSANGLLILYQHTTTRAPFGSFFKGAFIHSAVSLPNGHKLLGWKELIEYDPSGKTPPAPFRLRAGEKSFATNAFASVSLGGKYNLLVHDVIPGGATVIDQNQTVVTEYHGTTDLSGSDLISASLDQQNNFWMGYYYVSGGAMTKMEHGQDVKIWNKENGLPGVLEMTRFKGKLYVATTDGLFVLDEQNRLTRIAQSAGTYYSMCVIKLNGEERLLVSDGEGLKEWAGNKFNLVLRSPATGFKVIQSLKNPNRIILFSTVRSLSMTYQNGNWKEEYPLGVACGVRPLQTPDDEIWITSDYGLTKINLDTIPFRTTEYHSPDGFEDAFYGDPFISHGGDIVSTYNKGLFAVDKKKGQLTLWKGLGNTVTNRRDKVFYVSRMDSGYFMASVNPSQSLICTITKTDTVITEAPFKRFPSSGNINAVLADKDGTVWIGGAFGLISYNPKFDTKNYNAPFNCLIREVKIAQDSTVFFGGLTGKEIEKIHPVLSYFKNQIRFDFAAPFFDKEEETLYSYRLLGQEDNWSSWSKVYYKEFSNLNEGQYTFQVKAKNIYDKESRIASFTFGVLPPWYRTWWAYAVYLVGGFLLVFAVVRWRTAQLVRRRKELEEIVSRQTAELRVQNENLNLANEELHTTNEKLVTTQKQLVASEKMASLGQLTAGIAHEINNPINFISGGVQALHILHQEIFESGTKMSPEELNQCKQEIAQLMSSMTNGVMRTATIIKSLREFSSPLDSIADDAQVDVHECLENSLQLISQKISNANILLKKDFSATSTVKANASQLSQVFVNIIDNAVYALAERAEARTIELHTFETEKDLYIAIGDNGGGIPEAVQPHIFEPFHTTREVGKGTGLGLFICYSIIQRHGGSISFTSNTNGTKFEIRIPKRMGGK